VIYDGLQHVEIYIFQLVYVEAATPTNSMFPQLAQFRRATKIGQIEHEGADPGGKSDLTNLAFLPTCVFKMVYSKTDDTCPPHFGPFSGNRLHQLNDNTTIFSTRLVAHVIEEISDTGSAFDCLSVSDGCPSYIRWSL
jgi:hypothetical protein